MVYCCMCCHQFCKRYLFRKLYRYTSELSFFLSSVFLYKACIGNILNYSTYGSVIVPWPCTGVEPVEAPTCTKTHASRLLSDNVIISVLIIIDSKLHINTVLRSVLTRINLYGCNLYYLEFNRIQ